MPSPALLSVRRRQLNRPDVVAECKVAIQPPSQALIEALGPIHIGDGQRHDLELHLHAQSGLRGRGVEVSEVFCGASPSGMDARMMSGHASELIMCKPW